MRTKATIIVLVVVFVLSTLGCASYFRVTDPTTGAIFYTKEIDRREGGAVSFTDARTGAQVTIQNSERIKVSKTEYQQAKKGILPTSVQQAQPEAATKLAPTAPPAQP